MKIVNVVPLKKGFLKNDLTYFTNKEIESGSIVTIALRNKKTLGLVLSAENVVDAKTNIKEMTFNLKKIIDIKEKSIFLKEYLESVISISKYFVSSKNSAITALIPKLFIEEYDKISAIKKISLLNKKKLENIRTEKLLLQETLENRISIYKTLIRENFAENKSVFIVLPTQNDVINFEEYLSKGIEQFTFSFHGGITSKKTIINFKEVMTTEHPVLLLGTVPYLSIPRSDVGVILVENESSSAYRMIARPHFDLRVFAEFYASKINAKFILSDTLLRFETIARRELENFTSMYPLSFRLNFNGEIDIQGKDDKKFKIITEESIQEIQNTIANKKNVFIFTLRKGLATETICRNCNEVVSCNKCRAPLVLHNYKKNKAEDADRFFVCNKCGEKKEMQTTCTNCNSWNLMPLGIGTDTVFEEVSRIFTKTNILKFDKESVKNRKEAMKIVEKFESNPGSIMVGSPMALFYLKNKVDLSIIASFDSFWSIPNFRISEKIIQLVVSIISKTKNKFIIQTKNNKDEAILAIKSKNLLPFVRTELEDRKKMDYPPFKTFIKIKHTGNRVETHKAEKFSEEILKEYKPIIFSGFVTQKNGSYITNTLIKIDNKKWSLPLISSNSEIDEVLFEKLTILSRGFEIFVNPEDLT